DGKNVYVRFECDQKNVPVTALQSTNNVGFGTDDFVGVGIDTSGNGSQVYYFETTPAGVRYQAASENARYLPQWTSSARATADGWEAILVVPLSTMRLHSGERQSWRMNFVRGVAGTAEHYSWAWDGRMTDAVGSAWPVFTDAQYWPNVQVAISSKTAAVRAKPHAEIFGLVSAGGDRRLFQQANGTFLVEPARPVGADVSVPLTNTINFVGTVDPDFSNVEIDQATIAPTEFARLLTEYRPFFTQGAVFLNPNLTPSGGVGTPNNIIFYSPRVGPFNSGQKLEGSFGDQAFGVMHFAGYNELTGSDFSDIAYGYLHALPDQSFRYWSDGVLAHDSLAGNDTTAEIGASAINLKSGINGGIDQSWEAGSYVPYLHRAQDLDSFVSVTKPNYNYVFTYQSIAPNYNPMLGYTTISDIHGIATYLITNGSLPWTKSVQTTTGVDRFFDDSGAVHQADFLFRPTIILKNQLAVAIVSHIGELRSYATQAPTRSESCSSSGIPRTSYTGYPHYYCPLAQQFSSLGVTLGYRDGTPFPIDVTYSEGPFGGVYLHQYDGSLSRQLNRRLSISINYDGTYASSNGVLSSQWLRRFSISEALSADSNVSLEYRVINGNIGVVPQPPGSNLAISFHELLRNGNTVYVSYGTPAAPQTLNRLIVKYIFSSGGGAGT
ncbi:MAG: hypothetical protein JO061_18000, partial [Acidobacteriaceae bacterium]|nr:hypothetical protein [Acidobacteriaceae bacterium]